MPYIIEELFDTIIYSATEMRKRFHSLHAYPDRLEYWKRLQKIFESAIALHTIRLGKFRILDTHIYNSIMKLPEKTINGFGHEQLIEPHHLLIELVKNPSIYRLSNNVMLLLYLAFIYGNYNGLSYSERNTGYKLDLTEDEVNSLGNIQTYIEPNTNSFLIKFSEDVFLDEYVVNQLGSVKDICHNIRELFQKNIII
jgi:hypothetical protein